MFTSCILNEVLSLNAQEYADRLIYANTDGCSSMKS